MYAYIYIHVCIYVCMFICTSVYMCETIHAKVCAHMHVPRKTSRSRPLGRTKAHKQPSPGPLRPTLNLEEIWMLRDAT